MIRNYFKIAFRNIRRYYTYSILNIIGMAIGMAAAILILLWVQDEWSYDRHFKNANELFRVIENQNLTTGGNSMMVPVPGALSQALKQEFPEIIRATKFCPNPLTLKKKDEFIEETVISADKDFLKMFDVKFISGNINTALDDPRSIVITEETAKKYFGNEEALGKIVESRGFNVTVTGVVRSMPENSHIQFNILIPIEWLSILGAHTDGWNERFNTYIELKKGTDSKIVEAKIHDFIKKYKSESKSELFLQNIKKVHLYSSGKYFADDYATGDITYVRIQIMIAIFILVIACINFLNLSTAQSSRRARDIGVRKVSGAGRQKLIFQFLGESLLLVFIAHVIAMILVELFLPAFNSLAGKHLTVNYLNPGLYIYLFTIVILCSLLAGGYPAFYLSSLKPLDVIKGAFNKIRGNTGFRRALVIFQFTLSILLITCTLIVERQLKYLQNKNLGFNKDNISYFMFPTRPSDPKLETLKKELVSNQDIIGVTRAGNPFYNDGTRNGFAWEGKHEGDDVYFHMIGVDPDYATTYRLEIKEGRFFSSEYQTDKTAIVINEEAEKLFGFDNPVGATITSSRGTKLSIIGVVKDFHIQSLHHKIGPVIMQLSESNTFYIRMKPDKIVQVVAYVEKTFKAFNPGLPIDFHFLDDDFDKLYRTERRIGKIFGYFSLLAIIISCLGLVGLSSFMTQRRTKEIGIRKINGATATEIFSMLSGEYIFWVIISVLLATPIAWLVMNKWLLNFAYRININLWVFLLSGSIALVVAFLTVGFQSYKAALKNPVDALRYE